MSRFLSLAVCGTVLLLGAILSSTSIGADVETLAEDTCILELKLPAGTTFTVDGKPYGEKRNLTYRKLELGRTYPSKLVFRFLDGTTAERTLLIRGGWRIPLRIAPPDASAPELVLQTGHTAEVNSVAFGLDGAQALTGSSDDTAILWDARTGQKLRTLSGHTGVVRSVAFSPDRRHVLTGAEDGRTRVWDLASGEEAAVLISLDGGKDWLVVNREGFFDGSEGGRQQVDFRVGGGLNVVPVDRFFQDFYRPGLLAAIWRGERPMPEVELGTSVPPKVEIVSPEKDGEAEAEEVTIDVQVTDEGGGIKGPTLKHNGSKVLAAGEARREGNVLRQSFTVRLIEGENRLRVEAASGDGSWESEPATLRLTCAAQDQERPELYLVAIGVNQYASPSLNLHFAASDAQTISRLFQERGKHLYAQVHATELVDADATRQGIKAALAAVAGPARPQDTLLVFVSGHGVTLGQRYYFLTHEFEAKSDKFEEDVCRDGLPMDELADSLVAVPALKRMLILDTCGSGGAIARTGGKARNPFAFRGAIERLSRSQGIFTLAACASTEETVEVPLLKHGVLTYALLAGLKAIDDGPLADQWVQPSNPEQVVSVLDWFSFADAQVPRLTSKIIGTPQDVEMHVEGNSFPVLPLGP